MKWTGLLGVAILQVLIGLLPGCRNNNANEIDTVATPVAAVVKSIHIADQYFNRKVQLKTRVYYRANQYHRRWLEKKQPNSLFGALVKEIQESYSYGFAPRDYHLQDIVEQVDSLYSNRNRTDSELAELDMRITASFFLFTTHLIEGRIRYPGAREFLWKRGMPLENDIAMLLETTSGADLKNLIAELQPDDPQYTRLQKALRHYRERIPADTLPDISLSADIKPGDVSEDIPLLRRRLELHDIDVKKKKNTLTQYDEDLQKSVAQFQLEHGLVSDGMITNHTVRALNQKLTKKADLISLNLERLRWDPHVKGQGDEIVINVPEYIMRVYRNGEEKIKMRVVLGAEYTPTPVFHDTLQYVVFSPTWAVPQSIFVKEFLPRLQDNPEHYDPERFSFYRDGEKVDPTDEKWNRGDLDPSAFRVIENPGENNSLGKVKFMMPNDHAIYLHDTPATTLFERNERALSHGCIRLEHPLDFARYLLADQEEWDDKRIHQAIAGSKPIHAELKKPFPVYIVYRTASVDDDGHVSFFDDIYRHDERQLARLTN